MGFKKIAADTAAAAETFQSGNAHEALLVSAVGDDIRFHDSVASIMYFGQRVRVSCDFSPAILDLGAFTIDYFLVIVDERVAVPMRGAP